LYKQILKYLEKFCEIFAFRCKTHADDASFISAIAIQVMIGRVHLRRDLPTASSGFATA
jgi:hypothetical protein